MVIAAAASQASRSRTSSADEKAAPPIPSAAADGGLLVDVGDVDGEAPRRQGACDLEAEAPAGPGYERRRHRGQHRRAGARGKVEKPVRAAQKPDQRVLIVPQEAV